MLSSAELAPACVEMLIWSIPTVLEDDEEYDVDEDVVE